MTAEEKSNELYDRYKHLFTAKKKEKKVIVTYEDLKKINAKIKG